jgi:hypothetical protein
MERDDRSLFLEQGHIVHRFEQGEHGRDALGKDRIAERHVDVVDVLRLVILVIVTELLLRRHGWSRTQSGDEKQREQEGAG